jgi:hypothetical protein
VFAVRNLVAGEALIVHGVTGLPPKPRLKTDGMDPVPSATVYRFILTVFVFPGKYGNGTGNGTGCTGTRIENGTRVFPSIFTE